ncbi:MAG: helix-hairpin-helix domain-containing protein [Chloroflexota bacterium]
MHSLWLLSEGPQGPNTSLLWLLLIALGFFFLMVVVGWLASRNKGGRPEVQQEAHGHAEASADDLESLEGIGPKVAKVLNAAGIHTFADLAKAEAGDVQKILDSAGLQMMNPTGWIEQAKLAAKGDKEGLARLQDELKGGRKV